MNFFEPPPEPPEPREPQRQPPPWFSSPDNELGVAVPTRVLLAATDDLAIAVVDVVAYSTGFALRVSVRLKPGAGPIDPRGFFMQMGRRAPPGSGLPDELLRFGIEFADGRRATNLAPRPRSGGESPAISLTPGGGGGGGRGSFEFRYWVYPLPPPGALTFAVEWPARGIELTRHEVDAGPIIDAGSSSEELWEDNRPIGGPGVSTSTGSSSGSINLIQSPRDSGDARG